MQDARISIDYDPDTDCPCESDQFKLYSFCSRHRSYKHPKDLGLGEMDASGQPKTTINMRRKIAAGTAFILSYFEHGECVWSLQGEGPQCQWDSVRIAGLLVWEGKAKDIGKDYASREKAARAFLKSYTEWANGQCYCYRLETLDGEDLDGCCGIIGWDWLVKMVKDENPDVRIVEAEGEASDGFPVEEALAAKA